MIAENEKAYVDFVSKLPEGADYKLKVKLDKEGEPGKAPEQVKPKPAEGLIEVPKQEE